MQVDPAKLHDFAARYTAAWCSQDPTSVAAFYSVEGSLKVKRWYAGGGAGCNHGSSAFVHDRFPRHASGHGQLTYEERSH